MNQKQIGIILIITGILLSIFVYTQNQREDQLIKLMVIERGSCFLEDGTCLHEDRNMIPYILGWAASGALVFFGIYIAFIDKTQQMLAEHQIKVSSALKEAAKKESKEEKFKAFLSGFSSDEKKIIEAVHEQEGIQQSTLRYRTGMSKTTLSLILKSLEERGIVSRKESGKTNKVFLRKKF